MDVRKDVVTRVVSLSSMGKDELVKNILSDKFRAMTSPTPGCTNVSGTMPTGLELLAYTPSPESYPSYAFSVCAMDESREDIFRHLVDIELERITNCDRCNPPTPTSSPPLSQEKKRRRGGTRRTESRRLRSQCEAEPAPDNTESSAGSTLEHPELPPILSLFVKKDAFSGDTTVMGNIPDILENFFPGTECVYAGIYSNPSNTFFVLFAVDNGRYRTSWRSYGSQNKLTWFTSHEDVDREVMTHVIDKATTVHVVRKRNGEIRYMGKCSKIDNVNMEEGSCSMYIS